jgi:N-acetylneuraminic acid mutarotase
MKSLGRPLPHSLSRISPRVRPVSLGSTLVAFLLMAFSASAVAQPGEWTYQFGYQGGTTSAAYFGTKGVASVQNNPGAREGGVTWTDASGNLWMFGGYGDSTSYIGYLNDLWMWNVSTKQWTWVGGDGTVTPPKYVNAGVYGTQGVATATNLPGGRVAAEHWVDATGKVWMYGGQGGDANATVGELNDLWRYDPATQQWTWISGQTTIPGTLGANAAVYGTLGVASAANTPGGRDGATTWIDTAGNLWLFGGETESALYNDLWMYSPTAGAWTWEGGSQTGGSAGVSGLPGIASATATPSARVGGFGWVDRQHNFWLFGGKNSSAYNDLWEYNPTTGQWTYWSGSNTSSASTGSYGTLGIPSPSNEPAGRAGGSAWTDANGNLWMFGGTQIALANNLNDLWLYAPSSNEWTWMGGSSTVQAGGTYGPQGMATATAYPGARDAQYSWVDPSGNFWLFGGWNSEPFDYQTAQATPTYWDDLWEYAVPSVKSPAVTVSPLALSFRSVAGTATGTQNVTLTNMGTAAITISSIVVTGANGSDYILSNGCGLLLAAGTNCTIGVMFSAPAPGQAPAALAITDSDTSSPQIVTLSGASLTATTTTLGGASSTITTDANDTLNVTVAQSGGAGTPTGSVVLLNGTTTVATLTLNAAGMATYAISQPPVGSTTYTAMYGGDANYAASRSGSFTVTSIAGPITSAPAWTWVSGLSAPDTSYTNTAYYPTDPAGLGVASTSNYPGYRVASRTWTDKSGNLWLWGGLSFNDLWKYVPSANTWTFLGGGNPVSTSGPEQSVYGTQGVAAAGNMPGYRSGPVQWIDSSGNLWLFGGEGPDSTATYGELNDLWEYKPSLGLWTWVTGSKTVVGQGQPGVYGTKGTAATGNTPGGRSSAQAWLDAAGNFWLFSGIGVDSTGSVADLTDVWMFNPTTQLWTWEAGPTVSQAVGDTFGVQGVAAAANTPSVRTHAMTWTDARGNLWMFGGNGIPVTSSNESAGDLNDLWMFNTTTKLWTFEGGTQTVNAAGTFGTRGTGSSNNVPSAREQAATFTDAIGNFWMFNPAQQVWTWVAGSNASGSTGTYGMQGVASTANIPSARLGIPSWTDSVGNFWMLGGQGLQSSNGLPFYNDLWKATPASQTAGAPAVTLNPGGPLSFSAPSGTSTTQSITLTNSGTAALTGFTIGLSSGLGAFSEADNCPASLAAGTSCTITIGFTPTAVTTYTGAVQITESASNSSQSIALNGTGTGALTPATNIYPASLTFAPTQVNTTNSGQSITIANSGTAPLTGITPSILGANAADFAVSLNTCGSLALGATCTISVTFTPPATGTFNATLSIADNAGNSPQAVPLSGTGAAAQELASIGPSFVGFANQAINTTSGVVMVTLSNVGSTALTNISPAITGAGASAFAISATTCGTSLAAGANCSISVTFTPGSTATFQATLTVTDDASNGPELVPLSGTGTAASATTAATISTAVLTFPNTTIGATSQLPVTVTNSGTQALSIEGIALADTYVNGQVPSAGSAGLFTQTSTCGATLAAGASCVITVTFSPTAGSLYSGTLLIADSSSSFAQAVSLAGVGTGASGTSAVLSPALNFGTFALNTTTAPMTTTLTNTGSATLTGITPSLSSNANFSISSTTCGNSLTAGATCTFSVTATSTTSTAFGATLNVADSAPGSPQSIALGGSSNCASTGNGACNPGGSVVVTNSSGVALVFQPATVTTATATAASTEIIGKYQGTVVYDQTFAAAYGTPTVQGGVTAANAAIVAAGGSGTVIPSPALTSTATNTSTSSASIYSRDPSATVVTTAISNTFGPATIKAQVPGAGQPFSPTAGELSECTDASLPGSTIPLCYATDAGNFQVLAGQEDVNVNSTVTYFIDTATTTTTTTTTTTAYSINGTAASTAPAVTLSPTGPLSFTTAYGSGGVTRMLTITNSGNATLNLTSISVSGANANAFSSNTCPATLAAGAACSLSVSFSPPGIGSYTATLTIADNATGSPQAVTLNGTSTAPPLTAAPAGPLSFTTAVTTTSAAQTVTIANTGSSAVSIPSIYVSNTSAISASRNGARAAVLPAGVFFNETNNCPSTLAAGATCTVSLTFSPAAVGSVVNYLLVQDGAAQYNPLIVTLNGSGTQLATTAMLAASATSVTQGSSVTLTATVTPATGSATPTGTVTFYDGSTALGTGAVGSNGIATFNTSTLAAGSHSITAGYGGDTNDATSTSTAVVLTITVPAAPAATLTPTGPLTFSATTGTTSAAQSVTLKNSGTSALSITGISLAGTNASAFAQTNGCGTSLAAGSSCTINVTFTPATASSFTAVLSIADNATGSPQSVTLNGTGTSTTPATFALNVTNPAQAVSVGGTATYTISANAQNGTYPGAVALTASGLPSGVVAVFTPQSITPGSGSATSQLTLSVPAFFAAAHPAPTSPSWVYASLLPVLGLGLAGFRRRRRLTALFILLAMAGSTMLIGCGRSFGPGPQTYIITITGTGATQTASTNITLTVP